MSKDARIPVTVLADASALPAALAAGGAAVLAAAALPRVPSGVAQASFSVGGGRHRFGCACCAGQLAAARALDQLFQARVRGTAPWFERVVAVLPEPAARAELEVALREDLLTMARFCQA